MNGYLAILWGAFLLRVKLERPKPNDLQFFAYRHAWNVAIARAFGFDLQSDGPRTPAGTLVVSNHQGFADIMSLIAESPAEAMLNFISKKEIGDLPIFGWHMRRYGDILFDRNNPNARKAVVSDALVRLKQGFSVVLFPEGTRSRHGEPKTDIRPALIEAAIAASVQIQPVGIAGTRDMIEKPQLRRRGHKIRLCFGEVKTSYSDANEVWTNVRKLWEKAAART